jgi:hypothetical protein
VFHQWGGEPGPEVYAGYLAHTRANLDLAVRYLRAKLYSIGIVEAIAEVTGGDVPLDYFMGGVPSPTQPALIRLEQFLPAVAPAAGLDPKLHRLLKEGRTSEVSFDTGASPLGAFLHAAVGEAVVGEGVDLAKQWWAGRLTAAEFLARQPSGPVAAFARAAANILDTRRERLTALADQLEAAPKGAP